MILSRKTIDTFQHHIYDFYNRHKRSLIWRDHIDPYWVVVSEIMLQQTQVPRVVKKFPEFIEVFPTFESLAHASLEQVLRQWQGMGYNRRGKFLQETAQMIVRDHDSIVPDEPMILEKCPGIGPATARSIVTFVYNRPEIFIETNIRRVHIEHFFQHKSVISDEEIRELVAQTLDYENPREWYYALMDYGTYLGKTAQNPNRKSKHYSKQSKFEGSKRQVRGAVLKMLLQNGPLPKQQLVETMTYDKERIYSVLKDMMHEGMIEEQKGIYKIRS